MKKIDLNEFNRHWFISDFFSSLFLNRTSLTSSSRVRNMSSSRQRVTWSHYKVSQQHRRTSSNRLQSLVWMLAMVERLTLVKRHFIFFEISSPSSSSSSSLDFIFYCCAESARFGKFCIWSFYFSIFLKYLRASSHTSSSTTVYGSSQQWFTSACFCVHDLYSIPNRPHILNNFRLSRDEFFCWVKVLFLY